MNTPSSPKGGGRRSLRERLRAIRSLPLVKTIARRLERHQRIYNARYYKFVESTSVQSRDVMADAIVRDLAPRTVLDVGCGTGALLDAIRSRDVQVAGLDYSDAGIARCRQRQLDVLKFDVTSHRLPDRFQRRDVAVSFEVAEHLPPAAADRFVDLLVEAGDVVVLGAATPGQRGRDHVNEQPNEYWIEKLALRGYALDQALTQRWRSEWHGKTAKWYHDNVMVFRRATSQAGAA